MILSVLLDSVSDILDYLNVCSYQKRNVLIRSANLAIRTGKLSFISILRIRIANFTEKMILFTSLKLFLTYVCSFIHFESNTWSTPRASRTGAIKLFF